jgi:DNA-binding NarL/FixJ family response regulator
MAIATSASPKDIKANDAMAKIFDQYISNKKIVIADSSATARSTIANLLVFMGAKTPNIRLASGYETAEAEVKTVKPHMVICDYDLGRQSGLNLLQSQRAQLKESKNSLFVLVTGNSSQSAVARAAEEDVDTFVLKPFTKEILRQTILKAALLKISPPEYVKTINEGKELLFANKFDEAIAVFEKARKLDPSPSLALCYIGQAKQMKKMLAEAGNSYAAGLEYSKIHYKCMVGLYEVLADQKRDREAYEVIKRISQYFPANSQRLSAVLRLAIKTQSYDDVERYYRIFTTIDTRSDEMVRYICAALVVCGKYYLKAALSSRALELFQKAAITGIGKTNILREIIVALSQADLVKQAEEFLKRFPSDSHSTPDYAVSNIAIVDSSGNVGRTIELGRSYIARGIADPNLYIILISASMRAKMVEQADDLVHKASQKWPEQKSAFEIAAKSKA